MTTQLAAAAFHQRHRGSGVKSKEARSIALDLLGYHRDVRRAWLHTLKPKDTAFVLSEVARETGTMYGLWHDAPVGFVEDVLGETMWGLQAQVLDAMALPGVKRVAVPAGFGPGKTFLAGRLVAWAVAVNPIGDMRVATVAPKLRFVKTQLWPHIKTAVAKGKLPGRTDTIQWVIDDRYGNKKSVAWGFSAAPTDESAFQGFHADPKAMLIVDEAGALSPLLGKATNNLLTGDARMLAIGNPSMGEPGSWFEGLCRNGEEGKNQTITIRISSLDSPAITGEPTPICRACVPNRDGHTIAQGINGESHLPAWDWLISTLSDYGVFIERGEDLASVRAKILQAGHPYLIAKVLAEFPKNAGNTVLPAAWIEAAQQADDPEPGGDWVRLNELDLPGETEEFTVKRGSFVRLGVDVAADGGDEFAIYRMIGDVVHKVHSSAGSANADATEVAEIVLSHIDAAQRLATAIGSPRAVRVKIDKNGLGWGVVGNLERWKVTGRHQAEIVGVMVSESPEKDDPAAPLRPYRKRDELWIAARFALAPDPSTGFGRLRLRVDKQCATQLSLPKLGNNSGGFATVEKKIDMKKRGLSSPDRAEAALLAMYEPFQLDAPKRRGVLTNHDLEPQYA